MCRGQCLLKEDVKGRSVRTTVVAALHDRSLTNRTKAGVYFNVCSLWGGDELRPRVLVELLSRS